jgi:cell division protein FtsB
VLSIVVLSVAVAVLTVQSRKHAAELKEFRKLQKLVKGCQREVQRVRDDSAFTEEEIDDLRDRIEAMRMQLEAGTP